MSTNQSVESLLKIDGLAVKDALMMKASERCIHRHTKEQHPNCFKQNALDRLFWYKNMKIGFLDIETSDFAANRGFMLSWAIKERNGDTEFDLVTRKEIFDFEFDRRIVKSCVDALDKYDIVGTYYGTGFDAKFLRSRAMINGIPFPIYGQLYHFDVYYRVKALLKGNRNSLDAACGMLGIEGKTHLNIQTWFKAAYGHRLSLLEVLEHNIGDVDILDQLFGKLEPYSKWTRKSF